MRMIYSKILQWSIGKIFFEASPGMYVRDYRVLFGVNDACQQIDLEEF